MRTWELIWGYIRCVESSWLSPSNPHTPNYIDHASAPRNFYHPSSFNSPLYLSFYFDLNVLAFFFLPNLKIIAGYLVIGEYLIDPSASNLKDIQRRGISHDEKWSWALNHQNGLDIWIRLHEAQGANDTFVDVAVYGGIEGIRVELLSVGWYHKRL